MTQTTQRATEPVYQLSAVAKLAMLPAPKVRRWLEGYTFTGRDSEQRRARPVVSSDASGVGRSRVVSFFDLVDVLWVRALLESGVTMPTIRKAAEEATRLFQARHPFCLKRFATDGRSIFLKLEDELRGSDHLLNIISGQYAMDEVLAPYLRYIDYEPDTAVRYWPLGKERSVVLDPQRSFGAPIVRRGVPTSALALAVRAEAGDVDKVARFYDVTRQEVSDAVEFEQRLAA